MKWDHKSLSLTGIASYWCSTSSMKLKHLKNRGKYTILTIDIVKYQKITAKERSELENSVKEVDLSERWVINNAKKGRNKQKYEIELKEKQMFIYFQHFSLP